MVDTSLVVAVKVGNGNPGGSAGEGGGVTWANLSGTSAGDPGVSGGGSNATYSTGGGGGGGCNGGSGIVVVRYQIGSVSSTKATGGSVSFYGGKTIHTFVNSGSFVVPSSISNVEYVVVGGGGAGGVLLVVVVLVLSMIVDHQEQQCLLEHIQLQLGQVELLNPVNSNGPYAGTGGLSRFGPSGSPIKTAPGGGAGSVYGSQTTGQPGGSGGGGVMAAAGPPRAGGTGSGDPFPGTPGASPANGWGHDGGQVLQDQVVQVVLVVVVVLAELEVLDLVHQVVMVEPSISTSSNI